MRTEWLHYKMMGTEWLQHKINVEAWFAVVMGKKCSVNSISVVKNQSLFLSSVYLAEAVEKVVIWKSLLFYRKRCSYLTNVTRAQYAVSIKRQGI